MRRTLLTNRQPGTARSRENAHNIRDPDAMFPAWVAIPVIGMIDAIAILAGTDLVASKKICMNGYPVGVFSTSSMLVTLKRVTTIIPKARTPFNRRLVNIDRGTVTEAFRISSDI